MRRWMVIGAFTVVLATLVYSALAPDELSALALSGERAVTHARAVPASGESPEPESTLPLAVSEAPASDVRAPEKPDMPGTVSLRGQVTDENGQPLEGVLVKAKPSRSSHVETTARSTTDAQGRFRLASLAPGPYELSFQRERFLSQKRERFPLSSSPAPLSIELQPAPAIQGRVVDALGNPLPEVTVAVSARASSLHSSSTTTAADGTFILDTPTPGEWRVEASLESFTPAGLDVTSPVQDVRLVLGAGVSVDVTVVDEQERPVPGAAVDLLSEATGSTLHLKATANEAGLAVLQGLEPGDYLLVAIPPSDKGFRMTTLPLRLSGEAHQQARLRFEPGPGLSGLIVDQAGRPIPDVEVQAEIAEQKLSPEFEALARTAVRLGSGRTEAPHTARSGADGRFTLSQMLALTYRLSFKKLGYSLPVPAGEPPLRYETYETFSATPGQSGLRVVLVYQGRVSGRVVRADGEPVTSFEIDLTPHESPDGTFTVAAGSPGPQVLKVLAPGVGGLLHRYEALEGQDVDVGDLVVGEGRPVRVLVVEDTAGRPLRDVKLSLRGGPDDRRLSRVELGLKDALFTAEDGTCLLPDVPSTPLSLTAERKGYEKVRVKVEPQEQALTVRLRRWAIVQGLVRAQGQRLAEGTVNFYNPDGSLEEDLRVKDGEFLGHVLPPGRYVAQAECNSCENPRPLFAPRTVDVPQPGGLLFLDFEELRGGATVEVLVFPEVRKVGLMPGQSPEPTSSEQLEEALLSSHPGDVLEDEKGIRYRNVPTGHHTILASYKREDGSRGFLRQVVEVPPTGLVRLELQPR